MAKTRQLISEIERKVKLAYDVSQAHLREWMSAFLRGKVRSFDISISLFNFVKGLWSVQWSAQQMAGTPWGGKGQRESQPRHKKRVQETTEVRMKEKGRARDEIKKYIGKPELKDKKIGLVEVRKHI